MIYTAVDNFYLSRDQLEASPSRADGVDAATEAELRRFCCDVVAEATVLLRLPQVVAATAQVLVQRFYCKRSLKKFEVKVLAMAAFWLAAKLEEVIEIDNPQKLTLSNVITVIDRVTRRREGQALAVLDPYSQKYEELKQQTTKFERHMLRSFGFVVHVEHPHRFVLNYCQMLMPGDPKQRVLQQEAWNMANDSLRTPLCVRFKAEVVACGILFTAARKLQIPLPEDPPWWALFEVREEQLVEVCTTLCDLYRQPRPKNVALAPVARAVPVAPLPAGARSPLQLTPPLRSPASVPRSAGTNLGSLLVQRKGSEGEAPSIAQQQKSGAAAGEPSTAGANGSAAAPSSGVTAPVSDKQQTAREADSKGERRLRSTSRSRSRSRGRGGSHSRRRHSRSRSAGDRGGGKRRRSSSRSPGKDSGRDRREDRRRGERREEQAIYRPGTSRPPRREERRREDHRERDYRGSGSNRR